MRTLARIGLGLCGLALVAPSMAKAADDPVAAGGEVVTAVVQAPKHQHKGLFGSRYCVECQRARAKKRDGVDVPPPPAVLPAGAIPGQVVHSHGQPGVPCAACEAGTVVSGPVTIVENYPAGHASVGGPAMASANAPGHAVVGPGEMNPSAMADAGPSPVGVSRSAMPYRPAGPQTAALGTRPGSGSSPYDPAVKTSSIPAAQTGIDGASTGRPHVIGHLIGVSGLRHDIQARRAARGDKAREAHAAITYDPAGQSVSDLPAEMVYGKGKGH
ncbi:hypothetical protein [Aquisphaera insulae]|uniref:hypothetical protein n=1 Tax=Aquisphaera insulae TaxID=2712864 RepID=UPI0013EB7C38|nr:hypothetical protein [Aquisphaera insulae]